MTMNSDLHITITYHISPVLAVSLLYNKEKENESSMWRIRMREREREKRDRREGTNSTMRIIRPTTSNRAIHMAPAEAPIIMPTDISVPVIGIPDATMIPSPPVLTART